MHKMILITLSRQIYNYKLKLSKIHTIVNVTPYELGVCFSKENRDSEKKRIYSSIAVHFSPMIDFHQTYESRT